MGRCVIELASKERRAVHQKTLLECCCKNISEYIPLDNSKGKFLYILVKKYNDFLVYTTDERAAVFGKVRTFQNEEEAYNNVLKRLRAF